MIILQNFLVKKGASKERRKEVLVMSIRKVVARTKQKLCNMFEVRGRGLGMQYVSRTQAFIQGKIMFYMACLYRIVTLYVWGGLLLLS